MNNEELKKKIVEVLKPVIRAGNISCNEENACKRCWFPCEIERTAGRLADALIAAGIGDISAWKHRAELAEAFHNLKCKDYDLLNYQFEKMKHRAARAERALHCLARSFAEAMCKDGDDTHCLVDGFIQDAYSQAEKELTEEGKDD